MGKVCKSAKLVRTSTRTIASTIFKLTLASIISRDAGYSGLSKPVCTILNDKNNVHALIDSGNRDNFIHPNIDQKLPSPVSNIDAKIKMTSASSCTKIMGMCNVDIWT